MPTRDQLNYEVDFNPESIACNPDPLPVKASTSITWKMTKTGYTFDGVTIDNTTYTPTSPGSGEFHGLNITTQGQKSVMSIIDTISDRVSHTYTLNYHADSAPDTQLTFDPTIENQD